MPTNGKKVAVSGISLRLPDANNKEEYWQNLVNKRNSITPVSDKRKALANCENWDSYFGEIQGIEEFDYDFFDISYDQAKLIDPQQRLSLEVAHETLEDAGLLSDNTLDERNIAVYTSNVYNSYGLLVDNYMRQGSNLTIPGALEGVLDSFTATRLTHLYNFVGPAYHFNSACSSFMVQLNSAFNQVVNESIEGALIVSSNLMPTDFVCNLTKNAGIISEDEKCRVFDSKADGSLLGEGVIGIYIESLETALKLNHQIYGVIPGIGINNDGFALSLTAPNPQRQYEAVKMAYEDGQVDPEEISYIEAHGTGTVIGDPIELNALSKMFNGKDQGKIGIGAAKTNVGHLLAAAGGVGLTKVLLSLKHKTLVPSINMDEINPKLQIEKTPFEIITEPESWEGPEPRKAGINCFGIGGTNSHCIVEEWVEQRERKASIDYPLPITLSAKTEGSLQEKTSQMESFLKETSADKEDIVATLNRSRKHYLHRAYGRLNEDMEIVDIKRKTLKSLVGPKVLIMVEEPEDLDFSLEDWKQRVQTLLRTMGKKSNLRGRGRGQILVKWLEEDWDQEDLRKNWETGKYPEEEASLPRHKILLTIKKDQIQVKDGSGEVDLDFTNSNFDKLIGELYLRGVDFNWEVLHPDGSYIVETLPAYPFEKKAVWLERKEK